MPQRGLQIAALSKLTPKGDSWSVQSQSGKGPYTVKTDLDKTSCTCLDFESRRDKCKHIYAVEFTIQRESGAVTQEQIAEVPLRAKKVYTQNWPAYRLAQINEKARLPQLLHELCSTLDEPIQIMGRPRLAVADQVFAIVFKVYSQMSTRRFMTDLREAHAKRYVSKLPSHTSVITYMEAEELAPLLKVLITQSSLPLSIIETTFAVDSSGFSTSKYVSWYDYKYGKEESERDWVKAHVICGTKTNVITAAEISGPHDHDTNFFAPLVNQTAEYFDMDEVSADKAYGSYSNFRLAAKKCITPYIDFKTNASGKGKCKEWNQMFHRYSADREQYYEHYHRRSNVESTFAMIKAKFGGFVRSKLRTAQFNEVLCKILCHNICCLIQSSYELNIPITFCSE